jgi:hypothetical protein
VLAVCEFVDQDLRASNIDESAASQTHKERAHESRCILNANAYTNTFRFNEGKTEENEENGFLRLGLVLSKRYTEGDTGRYFMEDNTNHQVHEN